MADKRATTTLKRFLEDLRATREAAGLTTVEAAGRAGMGQANWVRLEQGRATNPTTGLLEVAARAVGKRLVLALEDDNWRGGAPSLEEAEQGPDWVPTDADLVWKFGSSVADLRKARVVFKWNLGVARLLWNGEMDLTEAYAACKPDQIPVAPILLDEQNDAIETGRVVVCYDGTSYHVVEGYRLVQNARRRGSKTIKADVNQGTESDAREMREEIMSRADMGPNLEGTER